MTWINNWLKSGKNWRITAERTWECTVWIITEKIFWILAFNHTWNRQRICIRKTSWLSNWVLKWGTNGKIFGLKVWFKSLERDLCGVLSDFKKLADVQIGDLYISFFGLRELNLGKIESQHRVWDSRIITFDVLKVGVLILIKFYFWKGLRWDFCHYHFLALFKFLCKKFLKRLLA